jgi:RimJ/RimL family protein N-acetyltransferase
VAAARLDMAYRPVDMKTHHQWCENLGRDPSRVYFAIRKIDEPAIIGYVQISGINGVHRSAEIGIRIGEEKNRGHGYGTEALRLAVDFCWDHLNLNRLRHNERAIRAYKAAGFRKEGLLRQAAFIGGEWVDVMVMGALRSARKRLRQPEIAASAAAREPLVAPGSVAA